MTREFMTRLLPIDGKDVLILFHGERDPSPSGWETEMKLLTAYERRLDGNWKALRVLVFSDGGFADTTMRNDLNRRLKGEPVPMAVLAEGSIVRGMVTAMGWSNANVKAFATNKAREALSHLGLSRKEVVATLINECRQMEMELGVAHRCLRAATAILASDGAVRA